MSSADNVVMFRRTRTPGRALTPTEVPEAQMVVNLADGKLFLGLGSKVIQVNRIEQWNAQFTISFDGTWPVITTSIPYAQGTTRLYVGGSRLTLNADYFEIGNNQLELRMGLTENDYQNGSNITLDFSIEQA